MKSDALFTLTGNIYCNGGNANSKGGGGAGGWVHAFFTHGDFHSGLIEAKGGTSGSGEPGGPGVSYLQGATIRNLRIDNDCRAPKVG